MVILSDVFNREPMLEIYLFETCQLIEQLEQAVLNSEQSSSFEEQAINEIFRIMHTIKSSSAMMLFNDIATLAHSTEDLFYYLREEKPQDIDCVKLTDLVLAAIDFMKSEVAKIQEGQEPDGDASVLIQIINDCLSFMKEACPTALAVEEKPAPKQMFYISSDKSASEKITDLYQVLIFFEDGCEMENIRAFTIVHNLKEMATEIEIYPSDIIENNQSVEIIRQAGFQINFKSKASLEEINEFFSKVAFIKDLEVQILEENLVESPAPKKELLLDDKKTDSQQSSSQAVKQNLISVSVSKLDLLMDLIGELVVAEAMVTRNPDLEGLPIDNFHKAARQLRKITTELQDIVMSVRMVPLATTFQKMNRLVRDMSRKVNKEVQLEIIGEETEVDKNIIEQISDPLMHLIRNSIDHGLEIPQERLAKGKPQTGKITLEAKNSGGDVWITITDDGKGLDKEKILQRALEHGLLDKSENQLTEKEIYSLIFLPGFSTKEKVTEFSGRGVGMDVVMKNIEKIRGSILIDSVPDQGTIMTIKIPLTLAIIDGMTIKVGQSRYTVPITDIKESFKAKDEDLIADPEGNEMILLRGECYPVLRLHELYKIETEITQLNKGILMMVESDQKALCLFADDLLGQQQVVIKPLPSFIKKIRGIGGCTLLGDGSISLILDIPGLVKQ